MAVVPSGCYAADDLQQIKEDLQKEVKKPAEVVIPPKPPAEQTQPPKPETQFKSNPYKSLINMSLEELMQIQVAEVTTATKLPEKATAAPGTVIVVDKRDILLRGYSNLKDVLRDLPGMETAEYAFSEIGTLVAVRGITGNNKIVVLVDGMRVNPPGGEFFPFRSDFSVREAEQIEIVYGPGSTLYGQDAVAAVINVKTRKPEEKAAVEVGGTGGLHNEREGWVSFWKTFRHSPDIALRGYAQYHDSDLTRLDRAYPAYWQDFLVSAQAKGDGSPPERRDLGLNAFLRLDIGDSYIQGWQRQSLRSSSEGALPFGFISPAKWGDRSTVLEAKNILSITERIKLDSSIHYNRYEIDPASRFAFPASDTEWFLSDHKYGIGHGMGIEETLRVNLTEKLLLLAGVEASKFDIIPKASFPNEVDPSKNIFQQAEAPFVYFSAANNPGSIHMVPRVPKAKYSVYSGFFEINWQITDSLKTVIGSRVSEDTRFGKIPVTPRAALVFDINDKLSAKYSYTQAYVAPAPYFALSTFINSEVVNVPNPNLLPETALSHELNFTYTEKQYTLGLSGFYGLQSNLTSIGSGAANIIQQPVFLDAAGTMPRNLVHAVNTGQSMNSGMDFYGKANIHDVSTWFSYSYVNYSQSIAGNVTGLKGLSHHNGRVGVTWAAMLKLFVTPSLQIRSTPVNVIPGKLGQELLTPYQANLHVLYNASKNVDIFLDARNITNHKYALGGEFGPAQPEEALSGVVGIRMKF